MKKILIFILLLAGTEVVFAQTDTTVKQNKNGKATYSCPTHPWVKSKKPGKCNVCGTYYVINRIGSKQSEKVVYTCPMHESVVSDKADKCSKCGMKMQMKNPSKDSVSH